MYPFYENPPKTKQDVYDYITTWLQPVPDDSNTIIYDNREWTPIKGFRRASSIHCAYKCLSTGEYMFHVDEFDWTPTTTPNFGIHKDYDTMIDSVVSRYTKLWKLGDT